MIYNFIEYRKYKIDTYIFLLFFVSLFTNVERKVIYRNKIEIEIEIEIK